MPEFFLLQPPSGPFDPTQPDSSFDSIPIDFEDFIRITKGLSISSAAASSQKSRGTAFIELGLSKTFNLRIESIGSDIALSLIATLNKGEFPPIRVEIIGDGEAVTAELLQNRIYYLRQIYAMAFLLADNREDDVADILYENENADLESNLLLEEEKLVIQEASPGSLLLLLAANSRKAYRAVLYACAVPFAEGRKALLGRLSAGTELAELEVRAKEQDLRLKHANSVVDIAKKIDTIKDADTRNLIRERFLGDISGLASPNSKMPGQPMVEHKSPLDNSITTDEAKPTTPQGP